MVEKLCKRFKMSDLPPKCIPADPSVHLASDNVSKGKGEKTAFPYPYREAVGALLYVALMTRPDIAYAVGQVSKYCQNPNQSHWNAVSQIFSYLVGTKDYGIWLGGSQSGLVGYTNANFAGDQDDCRSTSGGIFFLHGGPVALFSKKQPDIAQSTTESEYIALCEGTKSIVFLCRLQEDFTGVEQLKIPIMCDNQSAVRLSYNPEYHQRTKHILVRYHYTRQKVNKGKIEIKYISTEDQLADILTKPLPGPKFTKLRYRIGVRKFTD
jgi:hypothetical protein